MGDYVREKARELDRVREAEARGEKNPLRTSEDVRMEYEIERRQEKMRELRARIRDLEAEVYVVREASDNWRECAEDWRKRAEKAEAENARLRSSLLKVAAVLRAEGRQADADACVSAAKRGTHG